MRTLSDRSQKAPSSLHVATVAGHRDSGAIAARIQANCTLRRQPGTEDVGLLLSYGVSLEAGALGPSEAPLLVCAATKSSAGCWTSRGSCPPRSESSATWGCIWQAVSTARSTCAFSRRPMRRCAGQSEECRGMTSAGKTNSREPIKRGAEDHIPTPAARFCFPA